MNIATYWYLASPALPASYSLFESAVLPGPRELLRRLGPAQGLVLAKWDEQALLGRVSALGVCVERMPEGARVDWREVDISLKPNPAGRVHWRTKPFFGFADSVVDRYGFADLFGERFPDLDTLTFTVRPPLPNILRRLPLVATPGYVYLVRSPYGIKIGKTVNIKSRTRLFEVKLPFPISVEHYAWFDNYSEAERFLHNKYRTKRLEGEWFDLSPEDVADIKTLGKPATQEEIRLL